MDTSIEPVQAKGWPVLLMAWLVALAATAGALFLGEVMGMTPCVLCWYQRIFMFPLALLLGLACYRNERVGAIYALPLALGGLVMALYHSALVAGWVPRAWVPCGAGASCTEQDLNILGGLPLPWLSAGAFAALCLLLFVYLRKTAR